MALIISLWCFNDVIDVSFFSCNESKQDSRACTVPCTKTSWGQWTSLGACESPEPLCQAGSRVKTRKCIEEGLEVGRSNCSGGEAASTMVSLLSY